MGPFNTQPEMNDDTIISIFERRGQKPTPMKRGKQYTSLFLLQKIFQEHINNIYEEKKEFVCRNRQPNPGKFRPILESGYLMIKDA